MISLKRSSLLLFGLLLTVFIASCSNPLSANTTTGSTTTANTNSASTANNTAPSRYGKTSNMTSATPMAKPTTAAQKNNNMGTQPPMGSNGNMMQGNSNALIHTTKVKLNGQMITVLTNAKGMILYYKLNDPKPASACTGACAAAWPPVLADSMNMMMVSSSIQLPHKLSVYKTANGSQVEYDGHPLYTYADDMTPGQFTGRGMGNVWYLVSLGL